MKYLLVLGLTAALLSLAYAIDDEEVLCNKLSSAGCEDCIKGGKVNETGLSFDCYWCSKPTNSSGPKCRHFTFNSAIPVEGVECKNLQLNVATCRLNVLVIIILIVLACFIFVVALCCVCCCCCYFFAKRRKKRRMLEEDCYQDEKEGIRQRATDRRTERKAKHDEIRKKYGLNGEEGAGTYKRME